MAKSVKKKNRKLRRQIRKTCGALLMASAIAVAAIPVPDISAQPDVEASPEPKVWVYDEDMGTTPPASGIDVFCKSPIPNVPPDAIVYTSGDGRFQFAYVDPGTGIRVATILNYNKGVLQDSSLTIPNTMEAFRKYRATSTEGYYCLVTQNDEFMFYDVVEQAKDSSDRLLYTVPDIKYDNDKHPVPVGSTHNIGESIEVNEAQLVTRNGQLVYVENEKDSEGQDVERIYNVDKKMTTNQQPCYYEQRSVWGDLDDTVLWYQDPGSATEANPNGNLHHPSSSAHYRIDASVQYIGKQFIEDTKDSDGNLTGWKIKVDSNNKLVYRKTADEGVFANNGNITNLIIGENMIGISDYAFQGCSTLNSVSFGNGLSTIGNGAFANCIRLATCDIPENANDVQAIGKDAFYNCTALTSFNVPIVLKALGDSCFEGCKNLSSINMGGGDLETAPTTTSLRYIGNSAFKDCTSLNALFLPEQYNEADVQIGIFEGCTGLQVVRVPNGSVDFKDTENKYTFEKFKQDVPESFYFWGCDSDPDMPRTSIKTLHKTANNEEIAYKYWDRNVYEVVVAEGKNANDPRITYQVNDSNELQKIWLENDPVNVVIPKKIGPYGIATIGTGCFDNACTIEKVTIPATVTRIAAEAFKGSHNLKSIIFDDSTTITEIGKDAFRTQVTSCKHTITEKSPTLTIVGAMLDVDGNDTVPFAYAMQRDNMINNNQQNESWITCHSGWPTNLEVKYDYDFTSGEGGSELQSYPRYSNFVDASGVVSETKIKEYVTNLPYVDENDDEEVNRYTQIIKEAISVYSANDPLNPPTVEQMQIINASRNIVVPKNVNYLKDGIFSGYTYKEEDGKTVPVDIPDVEPDSNLLSVLLNGVDIIEPFTFTGCDKLQSVSVIGAEEIADYAFGAIEEVDAATGKIVVSDECKSLTNVVLGPNITETGLRPFRGCINLTQIECLGDNLAYSNGLLFNNVDGGKTLVECLPGRGNTVGSYTVEPGELLGVTALQEEAFMDCNEIGKVDLSESGIDAVPERAFENADQLNSVVLPDTCGSIEKDAFVNCPMLRVVTIPPSVTYIEKDAFVSEPKQQSIEVETTEKSAADRYATQNSDYMKAVYGKVKIKHTVTFYDYPNYPDVSVAGMFDKQTVNDGEDATAPLSTPTHEGYVFSNWTSAYTNVTKDLEIYPMFVPEGAKVYSVKFVDWDMTELMPEQLIEEGKSAKEPDEKPTREGFTFAGWIPDYTVYTNVQKDLTVIASYTDNSGDKSRHTVTFYAYKDGTMQAVSTQKVDDQGAAVAPGIQERTGYRFTGWYPDETVFSNVTSDLTVVASYEPNSSPGGTSPAPSGSASASPNASASASPTATPNPADSVKKYTVSVSGGSGSGSYAAGAVVAINAYDMGTGQVFDKWTTSTAGVGFANANATSTTFTMPAANVSITATYKTGNGASSANSANSAGGGTNSNNSNRSRAVNGTTVQVTKPGISNTGLAGATVSGATDNFIVKVTEDDAAARAATTALQARYGDLSRIKYFPMDISLYDSEGRTKIADTSGISVNLTLPLPDDLIQYAGNNKMAAIANGALEDLNTRFTTVDGVPCVNFTATHFSPYVIYVDTANLTQPTIDATPKTGDPIHPKWFLAIGLACISLILFFKRDKVTGKGA